MRARDASLVALAAVLALGACVKTSPFVCATDEQCGDGRCEADGACSFADPTCHGAWRYGDDGDPAVAGRCVGDVSGPISALAAGSDHACARADDGRVGRRHGAHAYGHQGGSAHWAPLTCGPLRFRPGNAAGAASC